MTLRELDAVVVSNPRTFRYFSDHFPLLSVSPTRAWYVVIPKSGVPIACIPSIGRDDVLAESWITDVRTWSSPNPEDEGRSTLVNVLNELEVRQVGWESGREMRPAMTLSDYDAIRRALPGVAWLDAADLIWSLRAIKDESERSSIRAAIAAASAGFAAISAELRPGMTERDAARILTLSALNAGADAVPYLACGSGPGGYPSLTRAPTTRALHDGDVVSFDLGATVDGYWCDFNRNYALGTPHPTATAALRALSDVITAARAITRPGTSVATLRTTMETTLAAAGLPPSTGHGRWGHGVGLDFTEPPSLSTHDGAVLQPNMVITLEPLIVGHHTDPRLSLIAEDMLCITDTGHELLTTDQ